jgi:hypothetical protein
LELFHISGEIQHHLNGLLTRVRFVVTISVCLDLSAFPPRCDFAATEMPFPCARVARFGCRPKALSAHRPASPLPGA